MKTDRPLHPHVVSHTHWDREWYQPFETFRLRLVDLIDHLLEIFERHPDYLFELDAQTICLEDYLEIRPERRETLRRWIRSGNLRVGPWYVQNDFFLTSGEATIRNLRIGRKIAEEFGRCGDVGYAPDQFGLIRQLPQILAGFGIDSCIFGRGFDRRTRNEFYWESPDGSRVLASFLSRWYNNFQRLSADPARALRYAAEAIARQDEEAATSHRLLMNGVDHLEAQEDLLELLPRLPGFRQSTLRAFLDGVRQEAGTSLPVVAEEMRLSDFTSLLNGTLSTRTPLKRLNDKAQASLELCLEPLGVLLAGASGDPSFCECGPLRYAWKLLLHNHPHDSICGCSNARVHEDNENRFARLKDLTDTLLSRLFHRFWERFDRSGTRKTDYLLAVFHPVPEIAGEEVEATLHFPLEDGIGNFEILDPAGKQLPFEVLSEEKRSFGNYPPINLPGRINCRELRIRFSADRLPAMGYRVYTLRPVPGKLPPPPKRCATENEFLAFDVDESGRVTVTDRETGRVYSDLIAFRDEADLGHTYNFFPAPDAQETDLASISRIKREHNGRAVEVTYRFALPEKYDFVHGRRSRKTVRNRLTVRYSLRPSARRIDLEFEVENHASDHRLKVLFRTGEMAEHCFASVPFGFEKRPRGNFFRGFPNSGVTAVEHLAVFNCGLHECEYREDGALSLTLLRCVGRVTNSDFPADPTVAEPVEWCVPDANLHGVYRFEAAIRPGHASLALLEREYRRFLQAPPVAFDAADERKFTSGRPCEQGSDLAEIFYRELPEGTPRLPREFSLFRLEGESVLSCCKIAEDGKAFVVRVFNPDFERKAGWDLAGGNFRWEKVDLAERSVSGKMFEGGEGGHVLRSGEILSLKSSGWGKEKEDSVM